MKPLAIAMALAAATVLSATAVNAVEREPEQATVSLQNIDMNNAAQVQALHKRLERAAHDVCNSEMNNVGRVRAADRACSREALDQAVEATGNKALLAYHNEHQGEASAMAAVETSRNASK